VVEYRAEFDIPQSDNSLQQMLKVKELMGPVTSFWFDLVLPSLKDVVSAKDFSYLLSRAKRECESAVHKDDRHMPLGARLTVENGFRIRDVVNFAKDDRAAAIIAQHLDKLQWHSRKRYSRIAKFAKRRLLPFLKNWQAATVEDMQKASQQLRRLAASFKDTQDGSITPIADVSDDVEELIKVSDRIRVAGTFEIVDGKRIRVIYGEPEEVARCYTYPKSVLQSLSRPCGILTRTLGDIFVNIRKDSIAPEALQSQIRSGKVKVYELDISEVDMVSFSSVNRPLSVMVLKDPKLRRNELEYLLNPFAQFTELKRSTGSMVFVHRTVQVGRKPVRLMVELDGKLRPEIPLVQGTVLILKETDPNVDEFLQALTKLPVTLTGDGYIVSDKFDRSIGKTMDEVYKLQAPGRAKGIKLCSFEELIVRHNGKDVEIDVIQNSQGKRKNKLASIVAACLRYYSYRTGKQIVVKATEPLDEKFIDEVLSYCAVKVPYEVDGEVKYVEGLIGIQKFLVDDSVDYNCRIGPVAVDYAQFVFLQECHGVRDKFDRLPRSQEARVLATRAKEWIQALDEILQDIDIERSEKHSFIEPERRRQWLKSIAKDRDERLVIDAIFSKDIEWLRWLANKSLTIRWKDREFKLKMLPTLVLVNGQVKPSDFSYALLGFLDAYVAYVNFPTEKAKKWLALQIVKLQKAAASEMARAMVSPRGVAIVGRHGTSSRKDNVVLVPQNLYRKIVEKARLNGQMRDGEWYLIRHPVVGMPPKVKVEPADVNVILVPRHLAKYIDGDDDGDIVTVVPV